MTYHVEVETEKTSDLNYREILEKVAERTLDMEKCPYEAEVSLLITDDEQIQIMNRENRDIDRSTDVLSFPMVEYAVPAGFEQAEEYAMDSFNPETGELMLGDIVISLDHVFEQAEKYGHSVMREFAFLIAHSMLHLIGYDHMISEEAKVMEEKQEAILDSLGIHR